MDKTLIWDTVVKLCSSVSLPNIPTGDPFEYTGNEFCNKFSLAEYSIDTWNKAIDLFLNSNEQYVSAEAFKKYLDRLTAPLTNIGYTDKKTYAIYRKTNHALWSFTNRMFKLKAHIPDYLPTEEEAKEVGRKHGFTEEQLSLPIEQGGQLLAIRAFMAEYYCYKERKIPFPWVLKNNGGRVEWENLNLPPNVNENKR